MNRNFLPPLLRGIGTTILLLATLFGVIAARQAVQADQIKQAALHAKAEAAAKAQPAETRALAELMAETQELRSELEEKSVVEEVINNRWFDWASLLGTAVIASSFYTESLLQRRENG
jgi:hypothetical protein